MDLSTSPPSRRFDRGAARAVLSPQQMPVLRRRIREVTPPVVNAEPRHLERQYRLPLHHDADAVMRGVRPPRRRSLPRPRAPRAAASAPRYPPDVQ